MGVVFEWSRAQEQNVTTQAGDRRDRSPARVPGMPWRTAESLRFVDDQQIDSRAHRLVGELRALDQHLQRDHRPAMHVEGIELRTEIARHVGEALRIEEGEHLVVLSPELTQPLDGQSIRYDDQTAIDLSSVHEPIQDERGLYGLAETNFVGEQPTHGIAGARPLRDVELVRKEPDASPEKGPQAVGFAEREKVQDVQAGHEILDLIVIPQRQAFEERAFKLQRPQRVGERSASVCERQRSIRESSRDHRFLASRVDPDRSPWAEIHWDQRVRAGRQPQ